MERMTHYANNDLLTKSARALEEHEVFLACERKESYCKPSKSAPSCTTVVTALFKLMSSQVLRRLRRFAGPQVGSPYRWRRRCSVKHIDNAVADEFLRKLLWPAEVWIFFLREIRPICSYADTGYAGSPILTPVRCYTTPTVQDRKISCPAGVSTRDDTRFVQWLPI